MDASVNTTLIALLLALKDLKDPLSPTEQANLETVGEQLAVAPNRWESIEKGLIKVIEANPSLNQQYQATKAKLDAMDGNIPADLLPNEAELAQELGTGKTREIRGYKPGKPAQSDINVIINDLVVPILRNNDSSTTAKKISFLERFQKHLQEISD